MNPAIRTMLQSVLSTQKDLSLPEKAALQRLLSGELPGPSAESAPSPSLLLTQKEAAQKLSISRSTLWRLTRQGFFHPVEITLGTLRYQYAEIADFARTGCQRQSTRTARARPRVAA